MTIFSSNSNPNLNKHNLDIRHVRIIDALPVYESKKEVLTVGCGTGAVDNYLISIGYNVSSTDWYTEKNQDQIDHFKNKRKKLGFNLNVKHGDIFKLETFAKKSYENVICSEVLEHLVDYKIAFENLIKLTQKRLIITVPFERSFDEPDPPPKGHCNYWNDYGTNGFKSILEFIEMSTPYNIEISKIRTKLADMKTNSACYLIVINKESTAR